MKFSERIGLKPKPKPVQIDSMSKELSNRLWNTAHILVFELLKDDSKSSGLLGLSSYKAWVHQLWSDVFKKPIDVLPSGIYQVVETIRLHFDVLSWSEKYEFLEFILSSNNFNIFMKRPLLVTEINRVLQEDGSGFQIINGMFVPVTNEVEIQEIEKSISATEKAVAGAAGHIEQSLRLMAKKPDPDYRNSIKESISAVESVCKYIVGDKNADLSRALKKIESKIDIHKALKDGFQKIYAYTSDEGGIRHAMLEESTFSAEDARYMLISCSAFINYLLVKNSKAS